MSRIPLYVIQHVADVIRLLLFLVVFTAASPGSLAASSYHCTLRLWMVSFCDIVHIFSILENVVSRVTLGDLISLLKTCSSIRDILHCFRVNATNHEMLPLTNLRPPLCVGEHNTLYSQKLKANAPVVCSEPHHIRGVNVRGCLTCSMPVCGASIVKVSFGKREEEAFKNRLRSLCLDCYDLRTAHGDRPLVDLERTKSSPPLLDPREVFCNCTAKDGHLCHKCKIKQKTESQAGANRCHGHQYPRAKAGGFQSQICLWCGLRLPSECSRASAR